MVIQNIKKQHLSQPIHRLLLGLILTAAMLSIIIGCATMPGGRRTYSLETEYSKELWNEFKEARFDYGPYKDKYLGSNRGIHSFIKFFPLYIRWEHKDGTSGSKTIEIKPLIKDMKKKRILWFPTGRADLKLLYKDGHLNIFYTITRHQKTPKYKIITHEYLLHKTELK